MPHSRWTPSFWILTGCVTLALGGEGRAAESAAPIPRSFFTSFRLKPSPGTSERFSTDAARGWSVGMDSGTRTWALRASRSRSARPGELDGAVRLDRFAFYQIGFDAQADLSPVLTLGAAGTLGLMNRRMGIVEVDGRPRQSLMASAGLVLVHNGRNRMALDYLYSAPISTRPPFVRMSELIGGAPRAGSGFRASLLRLVPATSRASLELGLSGAALGGPGEDAPLLGVPPGFVDRRVTAEVHARF